ncbi:NAD(P)-binding protein [Dendrothele bispora CBS 962.96]|uniref:NAD(P)-binding protein n=1 Tax=Dendrothele bispora (strain CBS 962.96) TaxID=1314807 RepID=A0A4V4HEJ4_DENBC|nr:NAD(P)-binding protein [Dendrothele bispora CBS 962.96]
MSPRSKLQAAFCALAQKFHAHSHPSVELSTENKTNYVNGTNHVDNTSASVPSSNLAGKVAIITGSSKSIGASIAKELASQGANVVVNYVNDFKSADEVVLSIQSLGKGKAVSVKADACTISGSKTLVDETLRLFGRIDILVLNAGIMGSKTLEEVDEPFIDAHFNMNVKGPLFLVKTALPSLVTPGGRIIFFSTSLTTASSVLPNALCYVASKAAIEQVSRVLSRDLGARGITVNTVSPGPVDTPLFREGKPQRVIDSIAAQCPENRLGNPEDVAPVVAFLASPAAQWVNGQVIRVNGGFVV